VVNISCGPTLQLFQLTFVFSIVLATNPNIFLLVFAALGWAVSLYFGFFRYRQYVWSRNKVRYDLLQKIDQRRADLASKLLMFLEISTSAKPRKARITALFRRYFSLLQQIDFYQSEGVFDEAILGHLRETTSSDIKAFLNHDKQLDDIIFDWLAAEAAPGNFFSTLTFE
jgi:hypothetical protein